jgi:hypothetical protein
MASVKQSYKATGSIRELRINVCQYPERTRINLVWATREKGDEPGQGHLWVIEHEDRKPIKSFAHALNLAAWLARQALAGQMTKRR